MTADSVTHLDASASGRVVVCGSHGGVFPAAVALTADVTGIVFNDAAIGRESAGIAGLALLDEHGVPAAAVDARRCRIGLAAETAAGELRHVNAAAAALGLAPGMAVDEFVRRVATFAAADHAARWSSPGAPDAAPAPAGSAPAEHRTLLADGPVAVWAIDSASMARPDDDGAVLVTGSHAQLVGAEPDAALRARARLAVFNDAGGVVAPSRLDALDERGIAAVAVAAGSARIGDGRSSYADGVISAVNRTAAADGAMPDVPVRDLIGAVAGSVVA